MKKNKRLVPKRRFKEFENSGEWEEHKFGDDIISVQTGTNLLGGVNNDGTPLLKMGNIQRGYFSFDKVEYLDSKEKIEDRNLACYGDFLFNTRNTLELVGKGATWTGENRVYAFNSNIARFVFKDINTIFFNYLYNTSKMIKQVNGRAMGTTSVAAVYPRSLSTIEYSLPSIQEQIKIGKYMENLDTLITLQQQKLNKVKALKSAYLSDLFPKEGEKYPKLRFDGFTEPWERCRLSDFAEKAVDNRGKTPPIEINGKHPLIEVASLGTGKPDYTKVQKYLSNYSYNNCLRGYIKKGDILFSTVGSIGLVSLMDKREDAAIAQNIVAFRAKNDFIPEYLYALFSTEDNKAKAYRIVMGAVQPSIKVSQLVGVEYYISKNKKEQKLIGSCFLNLDKLITLHQDKLEKLQNIKKAYLNELFL